MLLPHTPLVVTTSASSKPSPYNLHTCTRQVMWSAHKCNKMSIFDACTFRVYLLLENLMNIAQFKLNLNGGACCAEQMRTTNRCRNSPGTLRYIFHQLRKGQEPDEPPPLPSRVWRGQRLFARRHSRGQCKICTCTCASRGQDLWSGRRAL